MHRLLLSMLEWICGKKNSYSLEGVADRKSSLYWRTDGWVISPINMRHHDGPLPKSSIKFNFSMVVIVLASSRICTVETLRSPALCVFTPSTRTFSTSDHSHFFSLNTFVVVLRGDSSWHCISNKKKVNWWHLLFGDFFHGQTCSMQHTWMLPNCNAIIA